MKPISITDDNVEAIQAALEAVNGRATQHTYTSYLEISDLVIAAGGALAKRFIPMKHAIGAKLIATSGQPVNNTYAKSGFSRVATRVTIERKSKYWAITSIEKTEVGQQGGGARLVVTEAQRDLALASFAKLLQTA